MATLGCISNSLQGGQFGHGFRSSLIGSTVNGAAGKVSAGMGPVGRSISTIVAGGTTSELTGGKFANGAITSAFTLLVDAGARQSISSSDDTGKMRVIPDTENIQTHEDYVVRMNALNSLDGDPDIHQGSLVLARFGVGFAYGYSRFYRPSEEAMLLQQWRMARDDLQWQVLEAWANGIPMIGGGVGTVQLTRHAFQMAVKKFGIRNTLKACVGIGLLACSMQLKDGVAGMANGRAFNRFFDDINLNQTLRESRELARKWLDQVYIPGN